MTPRRAAQLVRTELQRLGGLWVKAAQHLATRKGALSATFRDELSEIRDWAASLPCETAPMVIEHDLGRPLSSMFREFDVVPIASTTIGQVHVARLRKSDAKVAIKVLRPGIEAALRRDLRHIRLFLAVLQVLTLFSFPDRAELVATLETIVRDELDYRMQADAMREARRALRGSKVYAPRVFSRYCGSRVLVMEFVDGVLLSEYARVVREYPRRVAKWRAKNGIDPDKLRRLFLDQARLEGLRSSGRLRPGDIMLLRNNRIALLNFGSMGGALEQGLAALSSP